MPHTDTTTTLLFQVDYGSCGHIFTELGNIIRAPDLISAKRQAVDLGPDWTNELYVYEIDAADVNELRLIIEEGKAEARAQGRYATR